MTSPTSPASPASPNGVTVRASAKINLSLAVGAPRDDGYHPLATVYQAIALYDELTAAPAPDGEVTLEVDRDSPLPAGTLADVPTGERNLAVRAARLLAEHTGTASGARLRLRKAIPVAAGLAGGSTDAAAALVACDALWGTGVDADALRLLAAELGSDVPFCLLGGTALGVGRGEIVTPTPTSGAYHWVLATNERGLSTPQVYAELDRLRAESPHTDALDAGARLDTPSALLDALRAHDVAALGAAMSNDLQPAAVSLRPELQELLDLGPAVGAHAATVSGSGPTCLFLAADEPHAEEIGKALSEHGVPAPQRAVGPVPGARVVAR